MGLILNRFILTVVHFLCNAFVLREGVLLVGLRTFCSEMSFITFFVEDDFNICALFGVALPLFCLVVGFLVIVVAAVVVFFLHFIGGGLFFFAKAFTGFSRLLDAASGVVGFFDDEDRWIFLALLVILSEKVVLSGMSHEAISSLLLSFVVFVVEAQNCECVTSNHNFCIVCQHIKQGPPFAMGFLA